MDDLTIIIVFPNDDTTLDDIAKITYTPRHMTTASPSTLNPELAHPSTTAPHTILRFTNRYKRLGNPSTTPTSVAHEAHHKAAQARAALTDIYASTLQALTTDQRLTVLTTLATTRLLFATEVVPAYKQVKPWTAPCTTPMPSSATPFATSNITTSTTANYARPLHPSDATPPHPAPALHPTPHHQCSRHSPQAPVSPLSYHPMGGGVAMGPSLAPGCQLPETLRVAGLRHPTAWLDFATEYPKTWARFITHATEHSCQQDALGAPPIPTATRTLPPPTPAPNGNRPPPTYPGQSCLPFHVTTPPYITIRPQGTVTCAYKCQWCSYHTDTKGAFALHASTAPSWRAAPWHFAYDSSCVTFAS